MQKFETATQIKKRQAAMSKLQLEAQREDTRRIAQLNHLTGMALKYCTNGCEVASSGWGIIRGVCTSLPQERSYASVQKLMGTEEGRLILAKENPDVHVGEIKLVTQGGVDIYVDRPTITIAFGRPSFALWRELKTGFDKFKIPYSTPETMGKKVEVEELSYEGKVSLLRKWCKAYPLQTGLCRDFL